MLSVQEALQEPHTLITVLQNQVSLQHQILAAQTTLARQDQLLSCTWSVDHDHQARPTVVYRRGSSATGCWHAFGVVDGTACCGISTNDSRWRATGGLCVHQHKSRLGYLGPRQHRAGFHDGPNRKTSCGLRQCNLHAQAAHHDDDDHHGTQPVHVSCREMKSFICSCRNKNQSKAIYPKGTSHHTRLFRGPSTNDMKK
jgi:hypothetical protein